MVWEMTIKQGFQEQQLAALLVGMVQPYRKIVATPAWVDNLRKIAPARYRVLPWVFEEAAGPLLLCCMKLLWLI